jgi:hypothetical protein
MSTFQTPPSGSTKYSNLDFLHVWIHKSLKSRWGMRIEIAPNLWPDTFLIEAIFESKSGSTFREVIGED